MPALCRRLNYRNIERYPDSTGETVGVRQANGQARQVRWLGFIGLGDARVLQGPEPLRSWWHDGAEDDPPAASEPLPEL